MLSVRGAAAIAGDQQFMAVTKCRGNRLGDLVDLGAQIGIISGARKRLARAAEVLGHQIVLAAAFNRAATAHGHSQEAVHLT